MPTKVEKVRSIKTIKFISFDKLLWEKETRTVVNPFSNLLEMLVNNPVPVSLLSGDRKPQIRFLGNHHSGSGNLYHKSFRM